MSKGTNIASALFTMAQARPEATAIHFPVGPRSLGKARYVGVSYRALADDARRIAKGLSAIGLAPGARVALMVRPGPDFFALAFGLFEAGLVPVMVDPGMGLPSLKACLAEAKPEAFIGIPQAHAARVVLGWAKETNRLNVTVGPRLFWGGVTLAQVRKAGDALAQWSPPEVDSEGLAAVLFTSGSTGLPKGAEYTHGNFMAQVELLKAALKLSPGEIDLPTFPLFALFDPALGLTTVLPKMDFTRPAQVDPLEVLEPIRLFGITTMFGSPALLNQVSRYAAPRGEKLPSLKTVMSAGAPVPAEVLERFASLLGEGARIVTPYGATEALPVAIIAHPEILKETRALTEAGRGVCVGKPVEGVRVELIRITDAPIAQWEDGLRVTGEEIGELVVAGPNVTRAYFGREAATQLAKLRGPDGEVMHRMGDLAWRDEKGRLWFCGRKSHRVLTAQGPMFTEPCEAPFCTHPQVFRAALVGLGEPGAQQPVLCVELEKEAAGAVDTKVLFAQLTEIAARHPHTRAISRFLVHPAFPVDIRHNSKIFREKLRVWAATQP